VKKKSGDLRGVRGGYLSRYYEEWAQPCFPQRPFRHLRSPRPHWEICRPDIRPLLERGDMVFFYGGGQMCRGVLVVTGNLPEIDAVTYLGQAWLKWHRRQRCQHRNHNDDPDGRVRKDHVILGDPRRSLWVEPSGLDLRAREWNWLRGQHKIGLRRNVQLSSGDCQRLYAALKSVA